MTKRSHQKGKFNRGKKKRYFEDGDHGNFGIDKDVTHRRERRTFSRHAALKRWATEQLDQQQEDDTPQHAE